MGGENAFVESISFFPLKLSLYPQKVLSIFVKWHLYLTSFLSVSLHIQTHTHKRGNTFFPPLFFSFSYLFSSLFFPSTEPNSLRASLATSLNFCIVWKVNSWIYLLPTYFFEYTFQQTFYHFSIPFKYYFFILSLIFIYSFFNISLCIPNYYIFLIPNNYIFKSPMVTF